MLDGLKDLLKGMEFILNEFVEKEHPKFKRILISGKVNFPHLLNEYSLHDFFNVDELGLFYKCIPNRTLIL